MQRKRRPKIFVSYAHEDRDHADRVVAICERMGVEYFLDRKHMSWGDSITRMVGRNIKTATHIVVVLSPASVKSSWVPFEIGYAYGNSKILLPLLTHPSLDLPGYLRDSLYKTTLDDLEESLRRAIQESPTMLASRRDQHLPGDLDTLREELSKPTISVDRTKLAPHDLFLLVYDELTIGLPAENLNATAAQRLGLKQYISFSGLLAPLVAHSLVRVQKRTSGVRVVLFSTEVGAKYALAFAEW
jgi:hypothetical protein